MEDNIEEVLENTKRELQRVSLKTQALLEDNTAKINQIADLRAEVTMLLEDKQRLTIENSNLSRTDDALEETPEALVTDKS